MNTITPELEPFAPSSDDRNVAPAVGMPGGPRHDPTPNSTQHASDSAPQKKPPRTLGLHIFDNLLYTFFVNTTVIAASVAATYMTMHGKTVGAAGSKTRAVGTWFANRREPIMRGFEKLGVKSKQAQQDFATVAFSFIDGTIFSFLVKPIEDKREPIAKRIDETLGTTPENMRAYDAEPKQSWRSVIEGRALTSAVVIPVAMLMEKTGGNQKIFYRSGDKLANFVKKSLPRIDQWLTKKTIHHKNYFFQTGVFELFYTSICTAGLYFISRMLARKHPVDKAAYANAPHASSATPSPEASSEVTRDPAEPKQATTPEAPVADADHTPTTKVSNPAMLARLGTAEPHLTPSQIG